MGADLSKADYEALSAFRYAVRRFVRFSEEAAVAAGLAPQQYQAILAIHGYPGRSYITVGELAERLQIRHQSAVGLVDRLVAQKLAVRHPADADRRQVHVALTPHGEAMLRGLAATHREELRQVGPQLVALLTVICSDVRPSGG